MTIFSGFILCTRVACGRAWPKARRRAVLRRVEEVWGWGHVQTALLRDRYPQLKQFTVILVAARRIDQIHLDVSRRSRLQGLYVAPNAYSSLVNFTVGREHWLTVPSVSVCFMIDLKPREI